MSKVNLSEEVKPLNCTLYYLNMPAVITEAQDFRGILTRESITLFMFHEKNYFSLTLQLMHCTWWCGRKGMAECQQIIYYFYLHKNRGVGRSKSPVCIWHKPSVYKLTGHTWGLEKKGGFQREKDLYRPLFDNSKCIYNAQFYLQR